MVKQARRSDLLQALCGVARRCCMLATPPASYGEVEAALLCRRWCELTAPWRELIAAGTSWRELLQDLELRLDLDLGSDVDSEDREHVRGLFEAEYAEASSYEGPE